MSYSLFYSVEGFLNKKYSITCSGVIEAVEHFMCNPYDTRVYLCRKKDNKIIKLKIAEKMNDVFDFNHKVQSRLIDNFIEEFENQIKLKEEFVKHSSNKDALSTLQYLLNEDREMIEAVAPHLGVTLDEEKTEVDVSMADIVSLLLSNSITVFASYSGLTLEHHYEDNKNRIGYIIFDVQKKNVHDLLYVLTKENFDVQIRFYKNKPAAVLSFKGIKELSDVKSIVYDFMKK